MVQVAAGFDFSEGTYTTSNGEVIKVDGYPIEVVRPFLYITNGVIFAYFTALMILLTY